MWIKHDRRTSHDTSLSMRLHATPRHVPNKPNASGQTDSTTRTHAQRQRTLQRNFKLVAKTTRQTSNCKRAGHASKCLADMWTRIMWRSLLVRLKCIRVWRGMKEYHGKALLCKRPTHVDNAQIPTTSPTPTDREMLLRHPQNAVLHSTSQSTSLLNGILFYVWAALSLPHKDGTLSNVIICASSGCSKEAHFGGHGTATNTRCS